MFYLKIFHYPEYTISGYLLSLSTLSYILPFLIIIPIFLIQVNSINEEPKKMIFKLANGVLNSKSLNGINLILCTIGTILILLIFFKDKRPYFPNLTYYIENQNWNQAELEFQNIDSKKVYPDILRTFELYIKIHKISDISNYPKSKELLEMQNVIQGMLERKSDYNDMNTLTYSEISKAIYFAEDNKQPIEKAITLLNSKPQSSKILRKKGELLLATKNYISSKMIFNKALLTKPNLVDKAVIFSNLGNIFASTNKSDSAIYCYQMAEENYPPIRKYIFYSNFGYLLMLANKLDLAKDKIEEGLKIEPNDWYSYLNLGLIYDKKNQYLEAINNYQKVIEKTDNLDSKREAYIFMGRSLELNNQAKPLCLKCFLLALDRDTSQNNINLIMTNVNMQKLIYKDIASALLNTNTHGLEVYINWFKQKSK